MTPNEIEVLLHYHTSPSVHPRIDAPAVRGAIEGFLKNGIFRCGENDRGLLVKALYETTDKGNALVQMLCNTPYPTQQWVDANGDVIEFPYLCAD